MAINLDFLTETPLWEALRKLVQKIPTSVYYIIWIILTTLNVVLIQNPTTFGIDPNEKWVQITAVIISLAVLLFTRPKSPIDTALDEAAKAKVSGNELQANRIAEKVVQTKAARLVKST